MATPQQVQSRGRWSLILGTLFAAVMFAAVAYADDISNDIDASIDPVAELMPLNVGGANGTTTLYVTPRNGDEKNGCNLTGSTTLVLSVSSSNTAVATVSPSSVTFESCGDVKTLTIVPVSAGSVTISARETSNDTGGTFNLAPATFTVNVAPPPNTAPTIAVTGVAGGASYDKGSVPNATCQVTDAEDGPSSFAATLSSIEGPYASDGIGAQEASCSYTDNGPGTSLTVSASKTYGIVDPSAPTISYTLDPAVADGSNGWYKSDVSLTWSVSDEQSPNSLSKTGCVDRNITADQASTEYSCSASSAGGSAGPVTVSIKRDATAPSVSGAPTTAANGDGWYNNDVTIDWTCSDATSGLASACPADSIISAEGDGLSVSSGSVSDNAGNVASATSSPAVKIDKTVPNAPTAHLSPFANAQGWNNAAVTVTFVWNGDGGAAGAQSGPGSCTAPTTVSVESLTVDGTTVSGTCTDKAGNTSAATAAIVKLDLTEPTINADADSYVDGSWTNQTVTVSFNCFDALSGLLGTCPADVVVSSSTSAAGQNVSGTVSDKAGNTATSDTINVKVDKIDPTIVGSRLPLANAAGWNNTDVVVSFSCGDTLSGVDSCPTPVTLSVNGAGQSVLGTAVDNAGNTASDTVSGINIDKLAPSVAFTSAIPLANAAGWHKSNVTATFTATDTLSGFAPSGAMTATDTSTTSGEGSNVSVASPAFADRAGNAVAAGAASASFKIDQTAPTVALVGGPANGGAYYFGSVPAAPTCTASDSLSGVDGSCSISGYGTSVGSHTVSANAKDVAGNVGSSASSTYTVLAWTLNGFFQPVDMGGVFNTVKSGSTVPLKFRVFSGSTELTDTSAVKSMTAIKIACATGVAEDPIEELAPTGGTVLRYDTTGAQFIYNWKTSGRAGDCYRVTMTTQDLSTIVAFFKLK